MEQSIENTARPDRIDPLGPMRAAYLAQRPIPALIAGFAGALVAIVLWVAALVVWELQSIALALAIGFIVGIPIRIAGRGIQFRYGLFGGLLSALSCVIGTHAGFFILTAQDLGINLSVALFESRGVVQVLASHLSLDLMTLLTCLFAFASGFGSAQRVVRPRELSALLLDLKPPGPESLDSVPGAPTPEYPRSKPPSKDLTPVVAKRLPLRHRKDGPK